MATVVTTSLAGQQQFADLASAPFGAPGPATNAITYGDIDGDGDLDALFASAIGPRVFTNNGSGTFTERALGVPTAALLPAEDLALADLDRDGDLDVVSAGGGPFLAGTLFLNDGSGSFTVSAAPLPSSSSLIGAIAVTTGDLDGDGDEDLVFADGGTLVLINDGSAGFSPSAVPSVPQESSSDIALGDLDGDGDLDVVRTIATFNNYTGYGIGSQNSILINDGSGSFTLTNDPLPRFGVSTQSVSIGDVDGDRDLDLVFGNAGGRNSLFLNDGNAVFHDATGSKMPLDAHFTQTTVLADLDSDGDLDLVACNYDVARGPYAGLFSRDPANILYLNDGSGSFTTSPHTSLPTDRDNEHGVAAADIDGDGDLDLTIASRVPSLTNRVYRNDGSASFEELGAPRVPNTSDLQIATSADVDGDGDADLVWGGDDRLVLHLNDGRGRFTDRTDLSIPALTPDLVVQGLAFGDVDADGDLDLVIGLSRQGVGAAQRVPDRLLLNDGQGNFAVASSIRFPSGSWITHDIAFGDLDGDGDLDVLTTSSGYTTVTCSPFPPSCSLIQVPGQNQVLLNDGSGNFTNASATSWPMGNDQAAAFALGDVDGDQDLDVVVALADQGVVGAPLLQLRVNDGAGSLSAAATIRLPPISFPAADLALRDLDGDGDADLLGTGDGFQGGGEFLFVNDGAGFFTDETSSRLPMSTGHRCLLTTDVDGDRDLDLFLGGPGALPVLYTNDGHGLFNDATQARMPTLRLPGVTSLSAVDVDGDGDPDLLAAKTEGPGTLDLNLLRQIDAQSRARVGAPLTIDLYARYGAFRSADLMFPFVSSAPARIPIPSLGLLGLDASAAVPLDPVLLPPSTGRASIAFQVPNDPALRSVEAFIQAVLVQVPTQSVLTNSVRFVVE